MRQVFFWMHLVAGVLVSALVIFFSVTGLLLAYERPLLHELDHRFYAATAAVSVQAVNQPPGRVRMALDELIPLVEAKLPAPIDTLTVRADAASPVELQTAARSLYFADPFTGRVQGPVSPRARAFFAQVTALHRWFGLANANHAAAITIKGTAVLIFLFLLVSGPILWLPKRWTAASLRAGVVPRLSLHGRARNYNWHKTVGFWMVLPLAVVVVTGLVMAFPWANALLFRVARSPMPVRRAENANARRHDTRKRSLPVHLDQAFAAATSDSRDWQTASLRMGMASPGWTIVVDRGDGGQPQKRETVVVDQKTLQVVHREPFALMSRGQRWRSWVRFAHTGEAGGWWGETLAFATAAAAVVLSLTGLALSCNRLGRWRQAQSTATRMEVAVRR